MEQIANNADTTLDGAINSSVTSLAVTSAVDFSANPPFTINVEGELMRVTATAGTTFTVTRGSEGTVAATHPTAAQVAQVVTKSVLDNLFAEIHIVDAAASRPSSARTGTIYCASDMDYRWRYNGTNWDLIHPVYVPYANRMDISTWTALNQGSSVWTDIHGILRIKLPSTTLNVRGFYKTLPTAPWTANLIVGAMSTIEFRTWYGMMLYDSVSGKIYNNAVITRDDGVLISTGQWTNITTVSGTNQERRVPIGRATYLKWIDNNTNWLIQVSGDGGVNYHNVLNQARNTFLTPTNIGIMVADDTSMTHDLYFEMFGYWETNP